MVAVALLVDVLDLSLDDDEAGGDGLLGRDGTGVPEGGAEADQGGSA
jgi:hypothetical protein